MVSRESLGCITRRNVLKAGGLAGAAGFAGCIDSFSGEDSVEIELSQQTPEPTIHGQFAIRFKELVEEESEGDITVKNYFSSEIGSGPEQVEQAITGQIDAWIGGFGLLSSHYSDLAVLDAPYKFDGYEMALEKTNPRESDLIQELNDRFLDLANLRILNRYYWGTRQLTVNKEICTPSDLNGQRIRVAQGAIYGATIEGMGGNPVTMDFSEVPTALQQGNIDGQTNPAPFIQALELYQAQSHLILTENLVMIIPMVINEDTWDSLSSDQQDTVFESAETASAEVSETAAQQQEQAIDALRDEMTVVGPDDCLDLEGMKTRTRNHIKEQFPDWEERLQTLSDGAY